MANGFVTEQMTSDYGPYYTLYGAQAIQLDVGINATIDFPATCIGDTALAGGRLYNMHAPPIRVVAPAGVSLPFYLAHGFLDSLTSGFLLSEDASLGFEAGFSPVASGSVSTQIRLFDETTAELVGIITLNGEGEGLGLEPEVSGVDLVNDLFSAGDTLVVRTMESASTSIDSVLLHYRAGGETRYRAKHLEKLGTAWQGRLGLAFANGRGLDCYLAAYNGRAVEWWNAPDEPLRFKSFIREYPVPLPAVGGRFQMYSVPFVLVDTSVEGVFGDDLGPPSESEWRMFFYDRSIRQYVEATDPGAVSLSRGTGFWLVSRTDRRLDVEPAGAFSSPHDHPFQMRLLPGWNLIGSPFVFAVSWDSVTVDGIAYDDAVNAGLVSGPVLWRDDAYVTAGVEHMEPWRGYWVMNMSEPPRDVLLSVPAVEAPPMSKALVASGEQEWRLSIKARCGDELVDEACLGAAPSADDLWDSQDVPEPPMSPGGGIAAYFPHMEWQRRAGHYTSDIRRAATGKSGPVNQVWALDVACDSDPQNGAENATLEFLSNGALPIGTKVHLVDRLLGRNLELGNQSSYRFLLSTRSFVSGEAEARFAVLLGSEDFIDRRVNELIVLPERSSLFSNYPNPFNPTTVIRCELAQAGVVSLRIYDLRGSLVKNLYSGYAVPGGYEFTWSGGDERGGRVASGVYVFRLQTDWGYTEARRMVLVR